MLTAQAQQQLADQQELQAALQQSALPLLDGAGTPLAAGELLEIFVGLRPLPPGFDLRISDEEAPALSAALAELLSGGKSWRVCRDAVMEAYPVQRRQRRERFAEVMAGLRDYAAAELDAELPELMLTLESLGMNPGVQARSLAGTVASGSVMGRRTRRASPSRFSRRTCCQVRSNSTSRYGGHWPGGRGGCCASPHRRTAAPPPAISGQIRTIEVAITEGVGGGVDQPGDVIHNHQAQRDRPQHQSHTTTVHLGGFANPVEAQAGDLQQRPAVQPAVKPSHCGSPA